MDKLLKVIKVYEEMKEKIEDYKMSLRDSGHPAITNRLSQLQEDAGALEKALGAGASSNQLIVLLEKEKYALIHRGNKLSEFAVVYGLNKDRGDWAHTCAAFGYAYDGAVLPGHSKEQAFSDALDVFFLKTRKGYITRSRLEELATRFKDGLLEDDKESALMYFAEECELTEEEMEWFGIPMEEESYV